MMDRIEEEKRSEQGDIESFDIELKSGSHDSASISSSSGQQNHQATKYTRRCKILSILGATFLLVIVLAVAIAKSPVEENIVANSVVGIDGNIDNEEEMQAQDSPTPPQQEDTSYLNEGYGGLAISTIEETVVPSQMPSTNPPTETPGSPTTMPPTAFVTPASVPEAQMTTASTTSPLVADESTTDDAFMFDDDFFADENGDGIWDGITDLISDESTTNDVLTLDDDFFGDDNGDGIWDGITEFACSWFSAFC
mmetsp:Transcript_28823/g.37134  ORF Transcript_28823/g.37134 Transcript_28823/m.37134 type:complete len:253 (-) Transcript_28823:2000-2758(-)